MSHASRLTVMPAPGSRRRGLIATPVGQVRCALGAAGITRLKREGDGATPAGLLRPLALLWRPDRGARPATSLPHRAIRPDSGWCDDPADRNYNRPVNLPYPARHERMWRDDRLYDLVLVLDWNMAPAVPGRGSAIFLHLMRVDGGPTEGCIAVAPDDMRRLLRMIGPDTTFAVG